VDLPRPALEHEPPGRLMGRVLCWLGLHLLAGTEVPFVWRCRRCPFETGGV